MGISLGANRYGKAESRVVRIVRDTPRHEIHDLTVTTLLRGDFAATHTSGDNCAVLPTDTQKNTAFAYAKSHGVASPESYAIALGTRLLEATPAAGCARVEVDHHAWERVLVDGAAHDHTFVRRGPEVRTVEVEVDAAGAMVVSGLRDLVVLKSTGSEFRGFLVDEYTTLPGADERVLATSLTARWSWGHLDRSDSVLDRLEQGAADWNGSWERVRGLLLSTFATTYSTALQATLFAMGRTVLEEVPEIAEISFTAPNKHHHLVDLAPFGLANDGEVFIAADRPYGLIEATVTRDDA